MIEIKRVALYARFSSDHQRTESIDAQIRAMKEFCNHNRWKIVETYIDEAYSATNDRRPNFQRMIADSGKVLFDIVLVHKLDCFSRNRYDSAVYKNKLKHNGVRLCSVLERLDDSPESIILEAMLESIGEYYSSNIAREAEAVRIIYDMYINGYGNRDIAERLNAAGYVTKKGNPFTPNHAAFYEILNNLKYTGTYVYNRSSAKDYNHRRNSHRHKPEEEIIRIANGCPAIISQEIFQKAAERRKSASAVGKLGAKHFYLCSGMVWCGECGKKMSGGKRYGKYHFHTYYCTAHRSDCCNFKEIDSEKLDHYVTALLERELFCEASMKKQIRHLNQCISRHNRKLPAWRKALDEQLDKLNLEYIQLQSSKEKTIEIYEQINTLESQRIAFESSRDNLQELEAVEYADFCGLIDSFFALQEEPFRFRTLIRDYIKSITVYRESVVFSPDCGFGLLDGVIKEIMARRIDFKTPSQRM